MQKLGFTLEFRYEDFYAGIEKDGHSIHLKMRYEDKNGSRLKDNEDLDLVFSVDDISSHFEEVSAKEVKIIQPLREMPYGMEFYIADPDGNVIAFME